MTQSMIEPQSPVNFAQLPHYCHRSAIDRMALGRVPEAHASGYQLPRLRRLKPKVSTIVLVPKERQTLCRRQPTVSKRRAQAASSQLTIPPNTIEPQLGRAW